MTTRLLPRTDWTAYFDSFSRQQRQQVNYAEIRVFSPDLGAQPETTWTPLHGISFDPRTDTLEVMLDALTHRIYHPQTLYVEEEGGLLLVLDVLADDGTQQLIEIR